MKRFFLASFATLFSILLGVFFTGNSVSATTVFDDNFSVAETLKIVPYGQNNTSTCDLSSSWGAIPQHDDVPQSVKDLWNNREGWSVSRHMQASSSRLDGNRYYDTVRISYWVTGDSMPFANWTAGQYGQVATWNEAYLVTATVDDNCELLTIGTTEIKQSEQLWNYQFSDSRTATQPFLTYNMDVNYPSGYEGETIPDTYTPPGEPEFLYPEYVWTLSKDENDNGILSVTYQDNLPHFLTGISSLEVMRLTQDWSSIDESLGILAANPAGWADWQFNIGDEAGYYMFRVTHNQQLDVPPWSEDDNYYIEAVNYQFYWDGQTFLNGTTSGCEGIVCNDFTFPEKKENRILGSLKVDSFGLTSVLTAPLNFFAQLPSKLENCSPVTIPFPHFGDFDLPCLTPTYQANLGVFFTLYQTTLIGAFAYYLGVKIFSDIKEISSPKNDSIEAIKL